MALTPQQAKARIDSILRQYQSATGPVVSIVPPALTAGKLYEAWTLCVVLEALHQREGYSVLLRQGVNVTLKSSPGGINRKYPYFELTSQGRPPIEIWTDVEFLSLSYSQRRGGVPGRADYHELDIVAVPTGTSGRPPHDAIWLGVECKNTGYSKELLRGILGVRRELSLLRDSLPTQFLTWPRATVPAEPPSCLMVYSTDPAVVQFAPPGNVFGIDFVHCPLP